MSGSERMGSTRRRSGYPRAVRVVGLTAVAMTICSNGAGDSVMSARSPWGVPSTTELSLRASGQMLGDADSRCVAIADLDLDGDLDAVVANVSAASRVWWNDGSGLFARSEQNLGEAACLALGDLDRDGYTDAYLVGAIHRTLLNDASGRLVPTHQVSSGLDASELSLADLDGDGDLDAVVANWGHPEGHGVQVWRNDGSGRMTAGGPATGGAVSHGVGVADLDGDNDNDAFVTNQSDADHFPQPNTVWLNDGSGLLSATSQDIGSQCSYDVALADLDGDGDVDAFVANSSHAGKSDPANRVWLNLGNGTFVDSGQRLGQSYSLSVALGDLDGDGDLDAFVGNYRSADRIWLNDGNAGFTDSGMKLGEANAHDVALGDLDDDGDLDVFVANNTWQGGNGANAVWLSRGSVSSGKRVLDDEHSFQPQR